LASDIVAAWRLGQCVVLRAGQGRVGAVCGCAGMWLWWCAAAGSKRGSWAWRC